MRSAPIVGTRAGGHGRRGQTPAPPPRGRGSGPIAPGDSSVRPLPTATRRRTKGSGEPGAAISESLAVGFYTSINMI
jgi:hypothetical protein